MKTRLFFISALLTALFIMTGCSPNLSIRLASDNTVSLQFESGTGQELTKTFTALTGKQVGTIQTDSAIKAMKEAGLTATGITQDGSQFTLTTGPDKADAILPGCPDIFRISSTGNSSRTQNSLSFTLSPETAQYIVSLLPEETASYTELFMAPLFTGEIMDSEEYDGLVAAVYGQQLADELDTSWFSIYIETPGTVTSVTIPESLNATSVKNDCQASIFIPLSSLLTLTDTHSILVFFDNSRYTN